MAREVKVGNKEITIRSLTRKEVKALKKKGFDIGSLKREQVDDLLDEVFPMILSPDEVNLVESSPYKVCIRVWTAVIKETYGAGDEEKNSSASGNGSQTEKE